MARRIGRKVDDAVAHHAAVEQHVPGRHQPVADVMREDALALAGARDLLVRASGPTTHDRCRWRHRRRRPARRRGRAPARACSRRRGRRHTSDAAARSRAGSCDARACGSTAAMPSRTIARVPAMSREPSGSPPTTSTSASAPSAAASSTARLLSSICALAAGGVGRGEHAAAAEIGDAHAVVAHDARGFREPDLLDLVAPGRNRGDAELAAGLDRLPQVELLAHGGEIDRETFEAHRLLRSGDAGDRQHLLHAARRQARDRAAPAPGRQGGTARQDARPSARSAGRRPSRNGPAAR